MREGEGRGSTYLPDAAQTVHKRQATDRDDLFDVCTSARDTYLLSPAVVLQNI